MSGSPVLCNVSVEMLFDFLYIKVRALLCVLNGIHNMTELMPGCFCLGVKQSLC